MELNARRRRYVRLAAGAAIAVPALILMRGFVTEAVRLVIYAGVIALVLCPLCRLYERRFPRAIAAGLCLLTAVAVLMAAVAAVAIPLVNGITEVYLLLPRAMEIVQQLYDKIAERIGFSGGMPASLPTDTLNAAGDFVARIASGTANIAGTIGDLVIAAVIAWHMLMGREQLSLRAELAIPSRHRQLVIRNASETLMEIMLYLRGQAIIALCVGFLSAFGLFIIGVPSGIPLGLTAGLLNMIPYIGPLIACIPVGLIALTEGLLTSLLSIGVLIAVQQIDGLILSPRIVGSATGFAPAFVMIAIFAAGAVWGVPGMLIALPVMILIRTCVRVFVELGHND